MKKLLHIPWYILFAAAYPILSLLANNITEVRYSAGIPALLLAIASGLLLAGLLRLAYRDWHRAAFASVALLLLFFTYGQVYAEAVKEWTIPHLTAWLSALWILLAVLALSLAGNRRIQFTEFAPAFNVASFALLIYPLYQVIWWTFPYRSSAGAQHVSLETLQAQPGQTPPDIYYFILDSYGSADLLRQAYGYDDSAFIRDLEGAGFYVAVCSQSNYDRTELSLGSSLNMDYLQNLEDTFIPANIDRSHLWNDLRYNAVRLDLEKAGYKTVAFATGFAWSEIDDADVFLTPPSPLLELNEFDTLLLRTTALQPLAGPGLLDLDQLDGQRFRERTLFDFSSIDQLARMPGPKFVFVHVIAPHPPFVFGPDGSPTDPGRFLNPQRLYTPDQYAAGYQNMVTFINQKVVKAVDTLINQSAVTPVIVLQGDHGPWLQTGSNQFRILNAYFLPGHQDRLYATISPVNTFRLILDEYLGAEYPLLPDVSYYSPVPQIFEFTRVGNTCQGQ